MLDSDKLCKEKLNRKWGMWWSSEEHMMKRFTKDIWLFATPWLATHQPSMSFIISWSLLRWMSIESVMPSNYLIFSSFFFFSFLLFFLLFFLLSIFPSIRVFSSELALHIRWPKYWSFSLSFSVSPSSKYSVMISFRIDWFYLLYGWFMLMFDRKQQNSVKQLSFH